jgi:ribosomal protein S18 acetylase RimI-like enzyme
MTSFSMRLEDIQPSQLYISEVKLKKVVTLLKEVDPRTLPPIPIKRIGDLTFFTDGHTRALALMEQGYEEVQVYYDQDDLVDWLQYLICVSWCEEANIKEIGNLRNRVVDHSTYRRLWHKRCDSMQKAVEAGEYEGINTEELKDSSKKARICESILRSLPEWFGIEEALQAYVRGVMDTKFFTVQVGSRPVGFASILEHNEFTSEIYCMGIFEEVHGRGLGEKLLQTVEASLRQDKKKFLTVKRGDNEPEFVIE